MWITTELVLARLQIVGKPSLYLGSYYRHTNNNPKELEALQENIQALIMRGGNLPNFVLGGDFNLPSIQWDNGTIEDRPQYGQNVNQIGLDIINNCFLTQMVHEPTRGRNTLDLILTTTPDLVSNTLVCPGISDHSAVLVDVQLRAETSKKKPRRVYLYNKMNEEGMKQDLQDMVDHFLTTADNRNADENWNDFKRSVLSIMQKHIPQKLLKGKFDLPWLTSEIKKLLQKCKKMYTKAKKSNRRHQWDRYKQLQRTAKQKIREAHDNYLRGLFEDMETGKPSRKFWSNIKANKKDAVGIPALRDNNGALATDSTAKARILSDQYAKVFIDEDNTNLPDMGPSPHDDMQSIHITTEGVCKLLRKLNPKKATGPDMISTRILRDFADVLAPALTKIFQQSMDTGVVPKDWKQANVTAIFKKGNKQDPANYRPVSLTSVSCKVLEHIVFSEVMGHLDRNNILVNHQHGFRAKRSCETQLIETISDLSKNLDEKRQMDVLILDFSKAFDTVPHNRLTKKLDYYGIRGNTQTWIHNWLTSRMQQVVIDGETSENEVVKSGVPRGAVSGPLMFLLDTTTLDRTSHHRYVFLRSTAFCLGT